MAATTSSIGQVSLLQQTTERLRSETTLLREKLRSERDAVRALRAQHAAELRAERAAARRRRVELEAQLQESSKSKNAAYSTATCEQCAKTKALHEAEIRKLNLDFKKKEQQLKGQILDKGNNANVVLANSCEQCAKTKAFHEAEKRKLSSEFKKKEQQLKEQLNEKTVPSLNAYACIACCEQCAKLKAMHEAELRRLNVDFKKREQQLKGQLNQLKKVASVESSDGGICQSCQRLNADFLKQKENVKDLEERLQKAIDADRLKAADLRTQHEKHVAELSKITRANKHDAHKLLEELKTKDRIIEQLRRSAGKSRTKGEDAGNEHTQMRKLREEVRKNEQPALLTPLCDSKSETLTNHDKFRQNEVELNVTNKQRDQMVCGSANEELIEHPETDTDSAVSSAPSSLSPQPCSPATTALRDRGTPPPTSLSPQPSEGYTTPPSGLWPDLDTYLDDDGGNSELSMAKRQVRELERALLVTRATKSSSRHVSALSERVRQLEDREAELLRELGDLREQNELLEFRVLELAECQDKSSITTTTWTVHEHCDAATATDDVPEGLNDELIRRRIADICSRTEDLEDKKCLMQILVLLHGLDELSRRTEPYNFETALQIYNEREQTPPIPLMSVKATRDRPEPDRDRLIAKVSPFTGRIADSDDDRESPLRSHESSTSPAPVSSRGTQTDVTETISEEEDTTKSLNLTAEVRKLDKLRETIDRNGRLVVSGTGCVGGCEQKHARQLEFYRERVDVLERKVSVYESSGEVQARQLAERLSREVLLEAHVKQLTATVDKLQSENYKLEEERCELEEAENDTRLRCQRLEKDILQLERSKMAAKRRARECRQQANYWEKMVNKYEESNYELEERECELRHRLEVMEKTAPAILFFNMWKMLQEDPKFDVTAATLNKLKRAGSRGTQSTCSSRSKSRSPHRKEQSDTNCSCGGTTGNQIKVLENERNKLMEAKNDMEQKVQALENQLNDLKQSTSTVPSSYSGVPSATSLMSGDFELISAVQELKERENQMKKRIEELERREAAYMETLQQADEIWAEMETGYKKRITDAEQSEADMRDRLRRIEQRKPVNYDEIDDTERELCAQTKRLSHDNTRLQQEKKRLEEELSCLCRIRDEKTRELETRIDTIKGELETERRRSQALEQRVSDGDAALAEALRAHSAETEALRERLARTANELVHLEVTNGELREEVETLETKIAEVERGAQTRAATDEHTISGLSQELNERDKELAELKRKEEASKAGERLGTALAGVKTCDACSHSVPANLVETLEGVRTLCQLMSCPARRPPDDTQVRYRGKYKDVKKTCTIHTCPYFVKSKLKPEMRAPVTLPEPITPPEPKKETEHFECSTEICEKLLLAEKKSEVSSKTSSVSKLSSVDLEESYVSTSEKSSKSAVSDIPLSADEDETETNVELDTTDTEMADENVTKLDSEQISIVCPKTKATDSSFVCLKTCAAPCFKTLEVTKIPEKDAEITEKESKDLEKLEVPAEPEAEEVEQSAEISEEQVAIEVETSAEIPAEPEAEEVETGAEIPAEPEAEEVEQIAEIPAESEAEEVETGAEIPAEPEAEEVELSAEILAEPEAEEVEQSAEIPAEPEAEEVEQSVEIPAEPKAEEVETSAEILAEPEAEEVEQSAEIPAEPEAEEVELSAEIPSEPEAEEVEQSAEIPAEPEAEEVEQSVEIPAEPEAEEVETSAEIPAEPEAEEVEQSAEIPAEQEAEEVVQSAEISVEQEVEVTPEQMPEMEMESSVDQSKEQEVDKSSRVQVKSVEARPCPIEMKLSSKAKGVTCTKASCKAPCSIKTSADKASIPPGDAPPQAQTDVSRGILCKKASCKAPCAGPTKKLSADEKVDQFDLVTEVMVAGKPDYTSIEARVDMDTEHEIDGITVEASVTDSGNLELVTESPPGMIEHTMAYTPSGNMEITTGFVPSDAMELEETPTYFSRDEEPLAPDIESQEPSVTSETLSADIAKYVYENGEIISEPLDSDQIYFEAISGKEGTEIEISDGTSSGPLTIILGSETPSENVSEKETIQPFVTFESVSAEPEHFETPQEDQILQEDQAATITDEKVYEALKDSDISSEIESSLPESPAPTTEMTVSDLMSDQDKTSITSDDKIRKSCTGSGDSLIKLLKEVTHSKDKLAEIEGRERKSAELVESTITESLEVSTHEPSDRESVELILEKISEGPSDVESIEILEKISEEPSEKESILSEKEIIESEKESIALSEKESVEPSISTDTTTLASMKEMEEETPTTSTYSDLKSSKESLIKSIEKISEPEVIIGDHVSVGKVSETEEAISEKVSTTKEAISEKGSTTKEISEEKIKKESEEKQESAKKPCICSPKKHKLIETEAEVLEDVEKQKSAEKTSECSAYKQELIKAKEKKSSKKPCTCSYSAQMIGTSSAEGFPQEPQPLICICPTFQKTCVPPGMMHSGFPPQQLAYSPMMPPQPMPYYLPCPTYPCSSIAREYQQPIPCNGQQTAYQNIQQQPMQQQVAQQQNRETQSTSDQEQQYDTPSLEQGNSFNDDSKVQDDFHEEPAEHVSYSEEKHSDYFQAPEQQNNNYEITNSQEAQQISIQSSQDTQNMCKPTCTKLRAISPPHDLCELYSCEAFMASDTKISQKTSGIVHEIKLKDSAERTEVEGSEGAEKELLASIEQEPSEISEGSVEYVVIVNVEPSDSEKGNILEGGKAFDSAVETFSDSLVLTSEAESSASKSLSESKPESILSEKLSDKGYSLASEKESVEKSAASKGTVGGEAHATGEGSAIKSVSAEASVPSKKSSHSSGSRIPVLVSSARSSRSKSIEKESLTSSAEKGSSNVPSSLTSSSAKSSAKETSNLVSSSDKTSTKESSPVTGSPSDRTSPKEPSHVIGSPSDKASSKEPSHVIGSPSDKASSKEPSHVTGSPSDKASSKEPSHVIGSPSDKASSKEPSHVIGSPSDKASSKEPSHVIGSPSDKTSPKEPSQVIGSPSDKTSPKEPSHVIGSPSDKTSPKEPSHVIRLSSERISPKESQHVTGSPDKDISLSEHEKSSLKKEEESIGKSSSKSQRDSFEKLSARESGKTSPSKRSSASSTKESGKSSPTKRTSQGSRGSIGSRGAKISFHGKDCTCKVCRCNPCRDPRIPPRSRSDFDALYPGQGGQECYPNCQCEICRCKNCIDPNMAKPLPCDCEVPCECEPCKDPKILAARKQTQRKTSKTQEISDHDTSKTSDIETITGVSDISETFNTVDELSYDGIKPPDQTLFVPQETPSAAVTAASSKRRTSSVTFDLPVIKHIQGPLNAAEPFSMDATVIMPPHDTGGSSSYLSATKDWQSGFSDITDTSQGIAQPNATYVTRPAAEVIVCENETCPFSSMTEKQPATAPDSTYNQRQTNELITCDNRTCPVGPRQQTTGAPSTTFNEDSRGAHSAPGNLVPTNVSMVPENRPRLNITAPAALITQQPAAAPNATQNTTGPTNEVITCDNKTCPVGPRQTAGTLGSAYNEDSRGLQQSTAAPNATFSENLTIVPFQDFQPTAESSRLANNQDSRGQQQPAGTLNATCNREQKNVTIVCDDRTCTVRSGEETIPAGAPNATCNEISRGPQQSTESSYASRQGNPIHMPREDLRADGLYSQDSRGLQQPAANASYDVGPTYAPENRSWPANATAPAALVTTNNQQSRGQQQPAGAPNATFVQGQANLTITRENMTYPVSPGTESIPMQQTAGAPNATYNENSRGLQQSAESSYYASRQGHPINMPREDLRSDALYNQDSRGPQTPAAHGASYNVGPTNAPGNSPWLINATAPAVLQASIKCDNRTCPVGPLARQTTGTPSKLFNTDSQGLQQSAASSNAPRQQNPIHMPREDLRADALYNQGPQQPAAHGASYNVGPTNAPADRSWLANATAPATLMTTNNQQSRGLQQSAGTQNATFSENLTVVPFQGFYPLAESSRLPTDSIYPHTVVGPSSVFDPDPPTEDSRGLQQSAVSSNASRQQNPMYMPQEDLRADALYSQDSRGLQQSAAAAHYASYHGGPTNVSVVCQDRTCPFSATAPAALITGQNQDSRGLQQSAAVSDASRQQNPMYMPQEDLRADALYSQDSQGLQQSAAAAHYASYHGGPTNVSVVCQDRTCPFSATAPAALITGQNQDSRGLQQSAAASNVTNNQNSKPMCVLMQGPRPDGTYNEQSTESSYASRQGNPIHMPREDLRADALYNQDSRGQQQPAAAANASYDVGPTYAPANRSWPVNATAPATLMTTNNQQSRGPQQPAGTLNATYHEASTLAPYRSFQPNAESSRLPTDSLYPHSMFTVPREPVCPFARHVDGSVSVVYDPQCTCVPCGRDDPLWHETHNAPDVGSSIEDTDPSSRRVNVLNMIRGVGHAEGESIATAGQDSKPGCVLMLGPRPDGTYTEDSRGLQQTTESTYASRQGNPIYMPHEDLRADALYNQDSRGQQQPAAHGASYNVAPTNAPADRSWLANATAPATLMTNNQQSRGPQQPAGTLNATFHEASTLAPYRSFQPNAESSRLPTDSLYPHSMFTVPREPVCPFARHVDGSVSVVYDPQCTCVPCGRDDPLWHETHNAPDVGSSIEDTDPSSRRVNVLNMIRGVGHAEGESIVTAGQDSLPGCVLMQGLRPPDATYNEDSRSKPICPFAKSVQAGDQTVNVQYGPQCKCHPCEENLPPYTFEEDGKPNMVNTTSSTCPFEQSVKVQERKIDIKYPVSSISSKSANVCPSGHPVDCDCVICCICYPCSKNLPTGTKLSPPSLPSANVIQAQEPKDLANITYSREPLKSNGDTTATNVQSTFNDTSCPYTQSVQVAGRIVKIQYPRSSSSTRVVNVCPSAHPVDCSCVVPCICDPCSKNTPSSTQPKTDTTYTNNQDISSNASGGKSTAQEQKPYCDDSTCPFLPNQQNTPHSVPTSEDQQTSSPCPYTESVQVGGRTVNIQYPRTASSTKEVNLCPSAHPVDCDCVQCICNPCSKNLPKFSSNGRQHAGSSDTEPVCPFESTVTVQDRKISIKYPRSAPTSKLVNICPSGHPVDCTCVTCYCDPCRINGSNGTQNTPVSGTAHSNKVENSSVDASVCPLEQAVKVQDRTIGIKYPATSISSRAVNVCPSSHPVDCDCVRCICDPCALNLGSGTRPTPTLPKNDKQTYLEPEELAKISYFGGQETSNVTSIVTTATASAYTTERIKVTTSNSKNDANISSTTRTYKCSCSNLKGPRPIEENAGKETEISNVNKVSSETVLCPLENTVKVGDRSIGIKYPASSSNNKSLNVCPSTHPVDCDCVNCICNPCSKKSNGSSATKRQSAGGEDNCPFGKSVEIHGRTIDIRYPRSAPTANLVNICPSAHPVDCTCVTCFCDPCYKNLPNMSSNVTSSNASNQPLTATTLGSQLESSICPFEKTINVQDRKIGIKYPRSSSSSRAVNVCPSTHPVDCDCVICICDPCSKNISSFITSMMASSNNKQEVSGARLSDHDSEVCPLEKAIQVGERTIGIKYPASSSSYKSVNVCPSSHPVDCTCVLCICDPCSKNTTNRTPQETQISKKTTDHKQSAGDEITCPFEKSVTVQDRAVGIKYPRSAPTSKVVNVCPSSKPVVCDCIKKCICDPCSTIMSGRVQTTTTNDGQEPSKPGLIVTGILSSSTARAYNCTCDAGAVESNEPAVKTNELEDTATCPLEKTVSVGGRNIGIKYPASSPSHKSVNVCPSSHPVDCTCVPCICDPCSKNGTNKAPQRQSAGNEDTCPFEKSVQVQGRAVGIKYPRSAPTSKLVNVCPSSQPVDCDCIIKCICDPCSNEISNRTPTTAKSSNNDGQEQSSPTGILSTATGRAYDCTCNPGAMESYESTVKAIQSENTATCPLEKPVKVGGRTVGIKYPASSLSHKSVNVCPSSHPVDCTCVLCICDPCSKNIPSVITSMMASSNNKHGVSGTGHNDHDSTKNIECADSVVCPLEQAIKVGERTIGIKYPASSSSYKSVNVCPSSHPVDCTCVLCICDPCSKNTTNKTPQETQISKKSTDYKQSAGDEITCPFEESVTVQDRAVGIKYPRSAPTSKVVNVCPSSKPVECDCIKKCVCDPCSTKMSGRIQTTTTNDGQDPSKPGLIVTGILSTSTARAYDCTCDAGGIESNEPTVKVNESEDIVICPLEKTVSVGGRNIGIKYPASAPSHKSVNVCPSSHPVDCTCVPCICDPCSKNDTNKAPQTNLNKTTGNRQSAGDEDTCPFEKSIKVQDRAIGIKYPRSAPTWKLVNVCPSSQPVECDCIIKCVCDPCSKEITSRIQTTTTNGGQEPSKPGLIVTGILSTSTARAYDCKCETSAISSNEPAVKAVQLEDLAVCPLEKAVNVGGRTIGIKYPASSPSHKSVNVCPSSHPVDCTCVPCICDPCSKFSTQNGPKTAAPGEEFFSNLASPSDTTESPTCPLEHSLKVADRTISIKYPATSSSIRSVNVCPSSHPVDCTCVLCICDPCSKNTGQSFQSSKRTVEGDNIDSNTCPLERTVKVSDRVITIKYPASSSSFKTVNVCPSTHPVECHCVNNCICDPCSKNFSTLSKNATSAGTDNSPTDTAGDIDPTTNKSIKFAEIVCPLQQKVKVMERTIDIKYPPNSSSSRSVNVCPSGHPVDCDCVLCICGPCSKEITSGLPESALDASNRTAAGGATNDYPVCPYEQKIKVKERIIEVKYPVTSVSSKSVNVCPSGNPVDCICVKCTCKPCSKTTSSGAQSGSSSGNKEQGPSKTSANASSATSEYDCHCGNNTNATSTTSSTRKEQGNDSCVARGFKCLCGSLNKKNDLQMIPHSALCDCPECFCNPCAPADFPSPKLPPSKLGPEFFKSANKPSGDGQKAPIRPVAVTDTEKCNLDANTCKQKLLEKENAAKEGGCSCSPSKSQAAEPNKLVASEPQSFEETISGLQCALAFMQEKCHKKDRMIVAFSEELRLRSNSGVYDSVLNKITAEKEFKMSPDLDRIGAAKTLPCPQDVKTRQVMRTPAEKPCAPTSIRPLSTRSKTGTCKCSSQVDPSPLAVVEIRRIAPDSLLVKWERPASEMIKGYEVEVNGDLKSRVHSAGRNATVISGLMISEVLNLSVFAITMHGDRCLPGATAVYKPHPPFSKKVTDGSCAC